MSGQIDREKPNTRSPVEPALRLLVPLRRTRHQPSSALPPVAALVREARFLEEALVGNPFVTSFIRVLGT